MKAILIAMLLMTGAVVAVAAAPTASACQVDIDEPSTVIGCANPPIDYLQCRLTGHCD